MDRPVIFTTPSAPLGKCKMCHFLSLSDARAIDNKQASHAYPRRITKAQLGAHKPVLTEGVTGDGSYTVS